MSIVWEFVPLGAKNNSIHIHKCFQKFLTAFEHFHMDVILSPGLLSDWPYPLVRLTLQDKCNFTNVWVQNNTIITHKMFTNREFIHFSFIHKWSKLTTELNLIITESLGLWTQKHPHVFTNLYISWNTDRKWCENLQIKQFPHRPYQKVCTWPYTKANKLIIWFCFLWTTNGCKFHGLHILLMWKTKKYEFVNYLYHYFQN